MGRGPSNRPRSCPCASLGQALACLPLPMGMTSSRSEPWRTMAREALRPRPPPEMQTEDEMEAEPLYDHDRLVCRPLDLRLAYHPLAYHPHPAAHNFPSPLHALLRPPGPTPRELPWHHPSQHAHRHCCRWRRYHQSLSPIAVRPALARDNTGHAQKSIISDPRSLLDQQLADKPLLFGMALQCTEKPVYQLL